MYNTRVIHRKGLVMLWFQRFIKEIIMQTGSKLLELENAKIVHQYQCVETDHRK